MIKKSFYVTQSIYSWLKKKERPRQTHTQNELKRIDRLTQLYKNSEYPLRSKIKIDDDDNNDGVSDKSEIVTIQLIFLFVSLLFRFFLCVRF